MEYDEAETYQKIDKLIALSDDSLKMTFLQRVGLGDVPMNLDDMKKLQEMGLLTKGGRPTWPVIYDQEICGYTKRKMGISGSICHPD